MNKHQYLDNKCRYFLGVVDECVFPMCTEVQKGGLEQVGSGVAVEIDGKPYLLTAKHVLTEIFGSGGNVFIGDGSNNKPGTVYEMPAHTIPRWRYHPNTRLDLALGPVTMNLPGLQFFPIDRHLQRVDPAARGDYFLAGYPNSMNKIAKVNQSGGEKRLGIASVIVRVDQSLNFHKNKRSPAEFLGFKYKTVYENGVRKSQGTSLKGMSGCGLWYFPEDDQGYPYLAGILTEHYKGTQIGYAPFARFALEIP